MKISEIDKKLRKNQVDVLTTLLISQLLSAKEYQTWFYINTKTLHVYQIILYEKKILSLY